jgi:hypothetical protein
VLPVVPVKLQKIKVEEVRAFLKSDPPVDEAFVEKRTNFSDYL